MYQFSNNSLFLLIEYIIINFIYGQSTTYFFI